MKLPIEEQNSECIFIKTTLLSSPLQYVRYLQQMQKALQTARNTVHAVPSLSLLCAKMDRMKGEIS